MTLMPWNILTDQSGCQPRSAPSMPPSQMPHTCGQSSQALGLRPTVKNINSVPGYYLVALKVNSNNNHANYE